VSTLPIRNGNSIALMIRHILSALLLLSEYLTYEEWKRYSCSYYLLVLKPETSEYLTYKEWKHLIRNEVDEYVYVSTLPIRNGNYSSGFSSAIGKSFLAVSTLPIRNGNY